MPIRQKLEAGQHQVFSQSLRQTIKLLELPLLELRNTLEAELIENPALEEINDPSSKSADAELPAPAPAAEETYEERSLEPDETPNELAGYDRPIPSPRATLTEVLLRQLRIGASDERQIALGMHLIYHIDENGYLRPEIQTPDLPFEVTPEEWDRALNLIQTFDPAGVGARNLKECLRLQLDRKKDTDPLTRALIEEHLEDLADHHTERLCRKFKCPAEEIQRQFAKIHDLEPKPGRSYAQDQTVYIIPDISIEEKDGELQVVSDDGILPHVRISHAYRSMLRSANVDETTKEFIRNKIKNATHLINAIRTRRQTLHKVVSLIVDVQKEALLDGLEKLKPLSLKEIAERAGLHESTISRVVNNKFVQTPAGVHALRDLFATALKTTEGVDVSNQRLKMRIQELIDEEDKAHPLTDEKIAALIAETEKVPLARRTVAKYREALEIPPASKRRHK